MSRFDPTSPPKDRWDKLQIVCFFLQVQRLMRTRTMNKTLRVRYLPEAVRAPQVAEVSIGRHVGVGLAARNDGGCRKDCEGEKERGNELLTQRWEMSPTSRSSSYTKDLINKREDAESAQINTSETKCGRRRNQGMSSELKSVHRRHFKKKEI